MHWHCHRVQEPKHCYHKATRRMKFALLLRSVLELGENETYLLDLMESGRLKKMLLLPGGDVYEMVESRTGCLRGEGCYDRGPCRPRTKMQAIMYLAITMNNGLTTSTYKADCGSLCLVKWSTSRLVVVGTEILYCPFLPIRYATQ